MGTQKSDVVILEGGVICCSIAYLSVYKIPIVRRQPVRSDSANLRESELPRPALRVCGERGPAGG
jgi:hypothetical protein